MIYLAQSSVLTLCSISLQNKYLKCLMQIVINVHLENNW